MLIENINIENSYCEKIDVDRFPLVDRFYKDCKYKVKCGSQDHVYSLVYEGRIIAAARLLPQSETHFLLRNLCVLPSRRNQGVARHLMQYILQDIATADCYCFALPHLQNFYLSLGFHYLHSEHLPADIALLHQRYKSRQRDWVLMGHIKCSSTTPMEVEY